MGNKVYFMIKTAEEAGKEGYEETLKGLEAIPEVESIESVSGDYDLVARVDVPKRVVPIANKILESGGVKHIEILRVEPLEPNPFMEEVCSIPGGEGVLWCAQCGLCSASCPNVAQMDYSPRKIIALIRAGKRNEVLSSSKTATPTMHMFFVNSIKKKGRVHELGLMLRFYLRTNPFAAFKMLPVALKLLLHGRMPLRAKKIKGTEQIKAIIDESQVMGGAL